MKIIELYEADFTKIGGIQRYLSNMVKYLNHARELLEKYNVFSSKHSVLPKSESLQQRIEQAIDNIQGGVNSLKTMTESSNKRSVLQIAADLTTVLDSIKEDLKKLEKDYKATKHANDEYDALIKSIYISVRDTKNEIDKLVNGIDQALNPTKEQPKKSSMFSPLKKLLPSE